MTRKDADSHSFMKPTMTKLAAVLFITFAILGGMWHFAHKENLAFDSNIWKRAQDSNERLQMIDDLMKHHNLVGQSRAEIDKLLGVPKMDILRKHFPNYDYVYLLGTHESFLDKDGVWLCIRFENEVVSEAKVRGD